ncbi:hypothetical protein G3M48_002481 [Beauveria asiatica]|uniref:AB hydrolase-1 domain-containing protein n=1 Tax=Beauveria asiatica TaxID=1069075 RepID=A0AAW0RXY6_9HYPO
MAPLSSFQVVECKTIDGIIIRGRFYAVDGKGPAIIMTPGKLFNRKASTPTYMIPGAEDLADIVTHISSLPSVESSQITLWGMSFGGTVSACAAAVDRRVKALVMVCPILSFYQAEKRDKAFLQLIRDRQSQLRGNEPFMLPPFNSKGENPIGMAGSGGPGGIEAYGFMGAVIDRGAPNFRNKIALQTYQKLAMWQPKEILKLVDKTPVMMVTPELDTMSPPEEQKAAFELFPQTKKFLEAKGKGHLTVLSGEGSVEVVDAMTEFVRENVVG